MNPLVIKAIQIFMSQMPDGFKKKMDEIIDAMEDKYEEGSWKDNGMELAAKILRGQLDIPDYPDEEPEA